MGNFTDNAAKRLEPGAPPTPQRRLLIIDDEQVLLFGYSRALRSGFEVHTACSGAEALALLERDPAFDLVLCDLALGDMDGADVHESLTRTHPGLAARMVFCSGGATPGKAARFVETLGDRLLQKPLSVPELRARMAAFADRFDE